MGRDPIRWDTADILAERVRPGFGDDLAGWALGIWADGRILEYGVAVDGPEGEAPFVFQSLTCPQEVAAIVRVAARSGFAGLSRPELEPATVDDAATVRLTICLPEGVRTAEVVGVDSQLSSGSAEAGVFLALWMLVERYSVARRHGRALTAVALRQHRVADDASRREREAEHRAYLEAVAAADARITDRRCPACTKPCPGYRETCKHCGSHVGRRP